MSDHQKPLNWPDDLEWPAGLSARLAWVADSIGVVKKDGHNRDGGDYKYVSVNMLAEVALPKLRRVGVSLVPGQSEIVRLDQDIPPTRSGKPQWACLIKQDWDVVCDDLNGYQATGFQTYGFTVSTGDKLVNAAHRFAEKNALQLLLHVVSDEDPEAHSEEPMAERSHTERRTERAAAADPHAKINAAQLTRLQTIASKSGWSDDQKAELKQAYGVESSKDVTVSQYDAFCADLEGGYPSRSMVAWMVNDIAKTADASGEQRNKAVSMTGKTADDVVGKGSTMYSQFLKDFGANLDDVMAGESSE